MQPEIVSRVPPAAPGTRYEPGMTSVKAIGTGGIGDKPGECIPATTGSKADAMAQKSPKTVVAVATSCATSSTSRHAVQACKMAKLLPRMLAMQMQSLSNPP